METCWSIWGIKHSQTLCYRKIIYYGMVTLTLLHHTKPVIDYFPITPQYLVFIPNLFRVFQLAVYMTHIHGIVLCFWCLCPKHLHKVPSAADALREKTTVCVVMVTLLFLYIKASREMMTHCTMIHNFRVAFQCSCQQHVKQPPYTWSIWVPGSTCTAFLCFNDWKI